MAGESGNRDEARLTEILASVTEMRAEMQRLEYRITQLEARETGAPVGNPTAYASQYTGSPVAPNTRNANNVLAAVPQGGGGANMAHPGSFAAQQGFVANSGPTAGAHSGNRPGNKEPAVVAAPFSPGANPQGMNLAQPKPAHLQQSMTGIKIILAVTGGILLLFGILFLLIIAAQSGIFGPIQRVSAAFLFGCVLIGLGSDMTMSSRAVKKKAQRSAKNTEEDAAAPGAAGQSRKTEPGPLAILGAGYATLILDAIAATSLYHFLPMFAGFAVVGALAICGLVQSRILNSSIMAGLIGCGSMLLSPLLVFYEHARFDSVAPPIFITVLGIVMAIIGSHHGAFLRITRTLIPSVSLSGFLVTNSDIWDRQVIALVALAYAVTVLAVAVYETKSYELPRTGVTWSSMAVAISALPLLAIGSALTPSVPWLMALLVGAAYALSAAALAAAIGGTEHGRDLWAAVAVISMFFLGYTTTYHHIYEMRWLGLTVAATGAWILAARVPREWLSGISWVATLWVTLAGIAQVSPLALLMRDRAIDHLSGLSLINVVVLATVFLALGYWGRCCGDRARSQTWAPVAFGGLVLLSSIGVVVIAVVLGRMASDSTGASIGFYLGHLTVTVLTTSLAAALILSNRELFPHAIRVGFILGGIALTKLCVVDLAVLAGGLRVFGFIFVGAVFLAVAIFYRKPGEGDYGGASQTQPGHQPPTGVNNGTVPPSPQYPQNNMGPHLGAAPHLGPSADAWPPQQSTNPAPPYG